jgi:hypothetical protein
MVRRQFSLLLLCALLTVPARAEESRIVAVIPLDVRNGKLDAAARMGLEETLRTIAGDALVPRGYTVLTGETTLKVLQENGVDPGKACEASCALEAAKEMKARLFISGSIATSEGEHLVFVRLFDSVTGNQLASVKLEGATIKAVRKQFEEKADAFFEKGLAQLQPKVKPVEVRTATSEVRADPMTAVPGVGINGVVVGRSTVDDVLQIYGRDAQINRYDSGEVFSIDYDYNGEGEYVPSRPANLNRPGTFDIENGKVKRIHIGVYQKNLRTPGGCKSSDKVDCLIKEMGTPTSMKTGRTLSKYFFKGFEVWWDPESQEINSMYVIAN